MRYLYNLRRWKNKWGNGPVFFPMVDKLREKREERKEKKGDA